MSTLESIRFKDGKLELLDQLKLPEETCYMNIESVKDGWNAIHKMNVRGAPAIAIAGVLSLHVDMSKKEFASIQELIAYFSQSLDYLVTSRPTAVNMADAAHKLKDFAHTLSTKITDLKEFKREYVFNIAFFRFKFLNIYI